MTPNVLFDLVSPNPLPKDGMGILTYRPREDGAADGDDEIIPPPPKAFSGVHIPKK